MAFELKDVTHVAFTNANVRRELHGEEHVRAVDLSMTITGENTLLDLIEPGLREHHFCNHALKAGQETLPDVVIPLPNLRHPKLAPRQAWGTKQDRARGYRFILDFGLGEEGGSNVDLTDCVLGKIWYELSEGGSVTIGFTVQYNGEELQDDALYGRLAGLATVGEGHVQLLAPPTLVLVKGKNWRSGKPDAPNAPGGDDGEEDLLDDQGGEGGEQDNPEAAMKRAHGG